MLCYVMLCYVMLCYLCYVMLCYVMLCYIILIFLLLIDVCVLQSSGSETYTPADKAVIASLVFHPVDQVLLIATYNKLLFWNWNQPAPFASVETASPEEKVRYQRSCHKGNL